MGAISILRFKARLVSEGADEVSTLPTGRQASKAALLGKDGFDSRKSPPAGRQALRTG